MKLRRCVAWVLAACLAAAAGAAPVRAAEEPDGELGVILGAGRADNAITGGGNKVGALLGLRWASRVCDQRNWFADGVYSQYDHSATTDAVKLSEARSGLEYLFGRRGRDSHWYIAGALGLAEVDRPAGFPNAARALGSIGLGLAQTTPSGGPRIELRAERLFGSPGYSNVQLILGWSLGLKTPPRGTPRHQDRRERLPGLD